MACNLTGYATKTTVVFLKIVGAMVQQVRVLGTVLAVRYTSGLSSIYIKVPSSFIQCNWGIDSMPVNQPGRKYMKYNILPNHIKSYKRE